MSFKEYGNKEYGCGGLSCRFCKENYYSGTKNCFDMNQNMELPKEHFHITFSDFFKMLIDPNISKKAKKKTTEQLSTFCRKIQGEKENETHVEKSLLKICIKQK